MKKKKLALLIIIWTVVFLILAEMVFSIIITHDQEPIVEENSSAITQTGRMPALKQYNGTIYTFDLKKYLYTDLVYSTIHQYDYQFLASVLQGLSNRDKPQIFYNYISTKEAEDLNINIQDYWMRNLSEKDQYLQKAVKKDITNFKELLDQFKDVYNGVVVWDQNVPATSMIAATVSGVENLLPVRYDTSERSPYHLLVEEMKLPIRVNLVDKFTGKGIIPDTQIKSTGSAKNDAYLWAKALYLDKGLTSKDYMYYNMDGYTQDISGKTIVYNDLYNTAVINYDFYISNKAFFFDLMPTADYIPNDDPEQLLGTDYTTMKALLKAQYQLNKGEFFVVAGFVPWQMKYSSAVRSDLPEPVDLEWWMIETFSKYNGIDDGDALGYMASANHSLYGHVPLNSSLKQKNDKSEKQKEKMDFNKKYLCFYMGDYDSSAWISNAIAVKWDSDGRGKLPLAWCINGVLAKRSPHVFNYMYDTMTKNDYFVAGDNGFGYLNPIMLQKQNRDSDVPDALDKWVSLNQKSFKQFDLDIQGFLIAGHPGTIGNDILEAYSKFAKGIGIAGSVQSSYVNGVSNIILSDGGTHNDSNEDLYQKVLAKLKGSEILTCFRGVLLDPDEIYKVIERVKKENPNLLFEVIDPYTFYEYANQINKALQ